MRIVEKNMIEAIRNGKSCKLGNTSVFSEGGISKVYLHGNHIATIGETNIQVSLAGWPTPTTKSRINAITRTFTNSRGVYTQKSKVYGFGEAWPIGTCQWYTLSR